MLAGLTEWLDAYGHAWQERDPDAIAGLFTEDATYQWGPFGRRLRGRVMIREAWAEALETQANVAFSYEVLTASARGGIARWSCELDDPVNRVQIHLEGIFRLAFDEQGLCRSFEEWWNSKSDPLSDAT